MKGLPATQREWEEEQLYDAIMQNEEYLLRETLVVHITYGPTRLWPDDLHTVKTEIAGADVILGISKNGDFQDGEYKRTLLMDLSHLDFNDEKTIVELKEGKFDIEKLKEKPIVKLTQTINKTLKEENNVKPAWPFGTVPTKEVRRIMRNAFLNDKGWDKKDGGNRVEENMKWWNELCDRDMGGKYKIHSIETIDEDMELN